jgi:hypothetical protein
LLFTRPGFLTEEWRAGRRNLYIGPIRLFLVCFALSFFVFTTVKKVAIYDVDYFVSKVDKSGSLSRKLDAALAKRSLQREPTFQEINRRVQKSVSLLQWVSPAGAAVTLALLLFRRKRFFTEHMVWGLHTSSFHLLIGVLVIVPVALLTNINFGSPILGASMIALVFVYEYFALKRFYGVSTGHAVFLGIALMMANMVVNTVVLVGSYALGIGLTLK